MMTTVHVYALMSEAVYKSKDEPLLADLKALGWERHRLPDHAEAIFASGFYGRIYWHKKNNQAAIAFRGTVWHERANIQNMIVKKSVVNSLGTHVGQINELELVPEACEKGALLPDSSFAKYSPYPDTAQIQRVVSCYQALHEIKRISVLLITQPLAVLV